MKNLTPILLVALLFVYSCEGLFNSAPTVTYSNTNLVASFYEEGSSPAPSVNWNGTQGSFSMAPEIEGMVINSTNGIVTWTASLAPGLHEFSIVATNSSGQISIPMTIENAFQGTFTGTYDADRYFELEFDPDGTILIKANNSSDPDLASGTWTLDSNSITSNYTYQEVESEKYSIAGTLTQTANQAVITGNWYVGHNSTEDTPGGSFEVVLQN